VFNHLMAEAIVQERRHELARTAHASHRLPRRESRIRGFFRRG
jgi:hypothetical protein